MLANIQFWIVCLSTSCLKISRISKVQEKLSVCLTKHHSMGTCWGRGIAPRILDLDIRRWVVSFTPRPTYPRQNSSRYASDSRLNGPKKRSGRAGEEKNSHFPPGTEPPNPDRQASRQSLYRPSLSFGKYRRPAQCALLDGKTYEGRIFRFLRIPQ